jgi:hypothetical protein
LGKKEAARAKASIKEGRVHASQTKRFFEEGRLSGRPFFMRAQKPPGFAQIEI